MRKPIFKVSDQVYHRPAVQPKNLARSLKFQIFRKQRDCTIYVAKTKALISCTVTSQLICAFVFPLAKSRFSHEAAQMQNFYFI